MRTVVSGRFELGVSADQAIGFLTPEGERGWVADWDPTYPAGHPSQAAGTVFLTQNQGTETVWLIHHIDRDDHTALYARITPGHHAGTVHIRCEDIDHNRCAVAVTYDMTLLPGGEPAHLDVYEDARFEQMMDQWEQAITEII